MTEINPKKISQDFISVRISPENLHIKKKLYNINNDNNNSDNNDTENTGNNNDKDNKISDNNHNNKS